MKNKFLKTLVATLVILPLAMVFTACSGGGDLFDIFKKSKATTSNQIKLSKDITFTEESEDLGTNEGFLTFQKYVLCTVYFQDLELEEIKKSVVTYTATLKIEGTEVLKENFIMSYCSDEEEETDKILFISDKNLDYEDVGVTVGFGLVDSDWLLLIGLEVQEDLEFSMTFSDIKFHVGGKK